jgi:hypothetical protein
MSVAASFVRARPADVAVARLLRHANPPATMTYAGLVDREASKLGQGLTAAGSVPDVTQAPL